MKRWTLLATALALAGWMASVFAAAPVLQVPQYRPVAAKLTSTQFWCDLPAPPSSLEPVAVMPPLTTSPEPSAAVKPAQPQEPRRLVLTPPGERPASAVTKASHAAKEPPAPKPQRLIITPDAAAPPPRPVASPKEPRRLFPNLLRPRSISEPPFKAMPPVARLTPPLPTSWDQPDSSAADRPGLPREWRNILVKREAPPSPPIPWPRRDQGLALRIVSGVDDAPAGPCAGGVVAFANADDQPNADAQRVLPCSWLEEGPPLQATPAVLPDLSTLEPVGKTPAPRTIEVNSKTGPLVINVMQGGSLVVQQDPAPGQVKPASGELASPAPVTVQPTPVMPTLVDGCCDATCVPSGFLVFADLLILRPRTAALPYAGLVAPIAGTTVANSLAIDAVETEYDWNAGCRFGVGYCSGDWTFAFVYTHLETDGASTLGNRGVDTNSVYAALSNRSLSAALDGLADAASEDRRFHYDVYDVEVGPRFQPLANLECNAFVGLRAAEIADHSQVQYFDVGELQGTVGRDLLMQAWGLRGGLGGRYGFGGSGIALLGDASLSLLYADFQAQRVDTLTGPALSAIQVYRADVNGVVPVVELRLGVSYTFGQITVASGYEVAHWFNFYQHADVPGSAAFTPTYRLERGDLSLDGWFARASFRY